MTNSEHRASRQSLTNRMATSPTTVRPSFSRSPAISETAFWIFSTSVVMWLISEPVLLPAQEGEGLVEDVRRRARCGGR